MPPTVPRWNGEARGPARGERLCTSAAPSRPQLAPAVARAGSKAGNKERTSPPISGCSDAKERLDALAAPPCGQAHPGRPPKEGEKPAPADSPAPWRYMRPTVRTNLSRLRVQPHVPELVLGHAVTGLIKVYDVHDY